MDGVSVLKDGAKANFGCDRTASIVHLIRNSIKYVPSKDFKTYTSHLKKVYGVPSLKTCQAEFEKFQHAWSQFPGAVDVWRRNFSYERKVMYTTNAIEAINSSFRKVTKKGAFPNENALYKLLYLRCTELENKWENGTIRSWSQVLNQLIINDKFSSRIEKYLKWLYFTYTLFLTNLLPSLI